MTNPTTPRAKRAHPLIAPAAKRRYNENYEHRKQVLGLKRIQIWVLPEDAPRLLAIAQTRRDRALAKRGLAKATNPT